MDAPTAHSERVDRGKAGGSKFVAIASAPGGAGRDGEAKVAAATGNVVEKQLGRAVKQFGRAVKATEERRRKAFASVDGRDCVSHVPRDPVGVCRSGGTGVESQHGKVRDDVESFSAVEGRDVDRRPWMFVADERQARRALRGGHDGVAAIGKVPSRMSRPASYDDVKIS